MKKRIGLLLGVLLLIGATGCEKEPQKQDMTGAYVMRLLRTAEEL